MAKDVETGGVLAASWRNARGAVGFFTRLPVRSDDASADALAFAPVAGVVIGTMAAGILLAGHAATDEATVAAILAVAGSLLLTGALHEDGLTDVFDAMGARQRDRRLAIMRDSRIGTYGVCALVSALALRTLLLAALLRLDGLVASTALVAAAALSRGLCLWPLHRLAPARHEGLGTWAMGHSLRRLAVALAMGGSVVAVCGLISGTPVAMIVAGLIAIAVAEGSSRAARHLFGGHTGDVAGATQQLTELAFLLTLLICR